MGSFGPDQPHGGAGSVAPGKPPAFPVAEAIVSGLGSTEAPRIEAVIENGAVGTSDVRRASTATSHTPGNGLATVRLSAEALEPPETGGL